MGPQVTKKKNHILRFESCWVGVNMVMLIPEWKLLAPEMTLNYLLLHSYHYLLPAFTTNKCVGSSHID